MVTYKAVKDGMALYVQPSALSGYMGGGYSIYRCEGGVESEVADGDVADEMREGAEAACGAAAPPARGDGA